MNLHLITGGSGYVGSYIVKRLLELGEHVLTKDLNIHPKFNDKDMLLEAY